MLRIARLALLVEPLDLAVGQTQQALDRHAALQTLLAQRLDDGADHPPQLEHRLRGGDLLEAAGHGREAADVLFDPLAADPADQPGLELRAQPARPLAEPSAACSPGAGGSGAGCRSDFRFSDSSVPSDSSGLPRTARRSFSSGSSTSAMSRPPASTRSR